MVCFFVLNVFAINKGSLVVYNSSVVVEGKIRNATFTDAAGMVYAGFYNKKDKTLSFKLPVLAYQMVKITINKRK